jgi:hypothetical protein
LADEDGEAEPTPPVEVPQRSNAEEIEVDVDDD